MENIRQGKKELVKVSELIDRLNNCISVEELKIAQNPKSQAKRENRSQFNNIDRYNFALRIANTMKSTLKVNVKTTSLGAVNVGELGEIAKKALLSPNKRVLRTSIQGQKDLNRYHKSEMKVISKTSASNNWNNKRGAIVLIQGDSELQEGFYWLNSEELGVEFYNNDRLTHKGVKAIIRDYEIEMIGALGL